eukprot:SAG31_NODE_2069_length_6520_cov_9.531226_4_plen_88_part_00
MLPLRYIDAGHAHRMGAQFQKLFPAAEGGPNWVRSTLAALPMLRIVPTAGINGVPSRRRRRDCRQDLPILSLSLFGLTRHAVALCLW